jgi:Crp-like helix-turn-helix domain
MAMCCTIVAEASRRSHPMCASEQRIRRGCAHSAAGSAHGAKSRDQYMGPTGNPRSNQLLAALPASAYRRLLPHLVRTNLSADENLFRASRPSQFAYFPTSSVVTLSYAVEEKGAMAKAWPVGREGMVGISLFLGSPDRDNRADVQFAGVAFRISAPVLKAEFLRAGALQQLLLRYVFALVTQASQLGVCSHYHSTEQRLCRFLSRTFDRMDGAETFVTQSRIATVLGVRRESITESASRLQQAGIISYRRGQVTLINRKKLEARECGCGEILRRAFAAVIA